MVFNEATWREQVKQAKTSEELRNLVLAIPDDYSASTTEPATTLPPSTSLEYPITQERIHLPEELPQDDRAENYHVTPLASGFDT